MNKRRILIAAFGSTLLLAGCSGTKNRGLESVHQPVVGRTDYVFDVGTNGNALAAGEAQRLAGWMQSLRLGYGDKVAIDDPNAYGGGGIREDVQAQVARYGLLVSEETPVTGAPVTPGTVRVVVSRVRATVPGCPDYSRTRQPEFESNTSSNHGCAINSNIAAMIANPTDLVLGQTGDDTTDVYTASKAINNYRKSAPAAGAAAAPSGGK